MHVRGGSQWKQQRVECGPLRRAHPASGATWNVQVVRGKMSTACLWHACRALMVGILLMAIGASMATIGYYSNDFAVGEFRNNTTVRIKKEQRGLHLNQLSYLGPIIMGVGGFIVVASCVMTFEARDSAAKVVPARFKVSTGGGRGRSGGGTGSRRTTSVQSSDSRKTSAGQSQSGRWEQHLGLFKSSPGDMPTDRHALTAALVHFSRTLGSPKLAPPTIPLQARRISKSGSEPNLIENGSASSPLLKTSPNRKLSKHLHGKHNSMVHRFSRENGYLHPGMRLHRHAISVDETSPLRQDSAHSSQLSVTFDPTPEIIDIVPVHKKREQRTKRSDTSRKHVLSRQKPIEKEEPHSPKAPVDNQRRSSTMSDSSFSSRRAERSRRASTASRTLSFDSRCQNPSISSTIEINDLMNSPEKQRSPQKNSFILSTPSVEMELRSQLSICSEPTVAIKQLSCQSSIEPCVLEEESFEGFENEPLHTPQDSRSTNESTIVTIENDHQHTNTRPDSLILNTTTIEDNTASNDAKKFLYRSQSTKCFKKPKLKPSKMLSNDLDQIYVISSNNCLRSDLNDFYDSIDVIHERRSKNFSKFNEAENDKEAEVVKDTAVNENLVQTTVDIESHPE